MVVSTQDTEFILVLLLISYCIIFHANNCKPIFASPCTNIPSIAYLFPGDNIVPGTLHFPGSPGMPPGDDK